VQDLDENVAAQHGRSENYNRQRIGRRAPPLVTGAAEAQPYATEKVFGVDVKGAPLLVRLESWKQAFGIAAIDRFEIAGVEPVLLEATNAIS